MYNKHKKEMKFKGDEFMYSANSNRYNEMIYNHCGSSGLKLPIISLGLWHNFGGIDAVENMKEMLFTAFDNGITHFDIANNYGPPAGSAESNFGAIMKNDFAPYRDEMIISSKAGYYMWPGPYGDGSSRKYLISSCDQSLKRTELDYFDIFYSHRFDSNTPVEETMLALDSLVRSGKALYIGISSYNKEQTAEAYKILKELKTPFVIHQPAYSILDRWIENDGLKDYCANVGLGIIAFCPLAQGQLTDKYLNGIPEGSRAASPFGFLQADAITPKRIATLKKLNDIAKERGQSLAQMALAWVLRDGKVTSALIGASKASQIIENLGALKNLTFTKKELDAIDEACAD